jgi:hypothetical protein
MSRVTTTRFRVDTQLAVERCLVEVAAVVGGVGVARDDDVVSRRRR